MQPSIIGWDVGGAHVKAAIIEANGLISKVFQYPCQLWKGLQHLNLTVIKILDKISNNNCIHALTMTGELVDLFTSRQQGVGKIISTMQSILTEQPLFIYAGLNGFLKPQQIKPEHILSIASTNWLASATLTATKLKNGLFVDIGSTTTDILVLADTRVKAIGLTDYTRLISEELIYSGIIRTAVMSVTQSAYFRGQKIGLMAEYFATMADVYRLTGELNEKHDQTNTADGLEKTLTCSARRLSRMIGYDYLDTELFLWKQFAQNIKSQQKQRIKQACTKQLSRNQIAANNYFIGAGVGRFLVKQIADNLGYPYFDFNDLTKNKLNNSTLTAADCASAVSVALLLCCDLK